MISKQFDVHKCCHKTKGAACALCSAPIMNNTIEL